MRGELARWPWLGEAADRDQLVGRALTPKPVNT